MSFGIQSFRNAIGYVSSFLVPEKVETRNSSVSGMVEVHYINGTLVLDSANVNYSFGGLHTVLQKAFSQFNIKKRALKNVLILGFGGGSVASILQDEYGKDLEIVAVERDEVVIELAQKYFSIDKYKKLMLHCSDAYDFILNSQPKAFDLIVVDVFVDLIVPEKFQDPNFIAALSNNLSSDGIIFYNFIAIDEQTRDAGSKLYKRMTSLIGNTEWLRIFASSNENWLFVCDKTKKP
jgi:spermidine synthase